MAAPGVTVVEVPARAAARSPSGSDEVGLDGGGVRAYQVEITQINRQLRPGQKSMVLRVTDQELLQKTGGIVQGMSGSPILQNGRIIGAVTHVFVDDPTQGYGLFIEWMLDTAQAAADAA